MTRDHLNDSLTFFQPFDWFFYVMVNLAEAAPTLSLFTVTFMDSVPVTFFYCLCSFWLSTFLLLNVFFQSVIYITLWQMTGAPRVWFPLMPKHFLIRIVWLLGFSVHPWANCCWHLICWLEGEGLKTAVFSVLSKPHLLSHFSLLTLFICSMQMLLKKCKELIIVC